MRIVFVIKKRNWFRVLGPVIDAAIEDPDVTPEIALLNDGREGNPALIPSLANVPELLKGRCKAKEWKGPTCIRDACDKADAVISTGTTHMLVEEGRLPTAPLCIVFDSSHSCYGVGKIPLAELYSWPTPYHADFAVRVELGSATEIRRRSVFSGYTRRDQLVFLDKAEIKREWGIPEDKPVVTLIPDNIALRPDKPPNFSSWYYDLWLREGRWERFSRAIKSRGGALHILESLRLQFSYGDVVRAVRKFCDNNNAYLLAAPRREKDTYQGQIHTEVEEECVDFSPIEHRDYPQSVLKYITVADLVINPSGSEIILDIISAGRPSVSIRMPESAYIDQETNKLIYGETSRESYCESQMACEKADLPGFAWLYSLRKFIETFPDRHLREFDVDPVARDLHMERFTGTTGFDAGKIILRQVKEKFAQGNLRAPLSE